MSELKALLDTNIIIHRECNRLTNESIGMLCWWLDKLKYKKCIHQSSIDEIHKYKDDEYIKLIDVKMDSYEHLDKFEEPNEKFLMIINEKYPIKSNNDIVDNQLLYEVYQGKVDLLITEDNKLINKAELCGLIDKVLTIEKFINKCKAEYPEFKEYKFNSIRKLKFGEVNLGDNFFDSLKQNYKDFERWYNGKSNEIAYVHYDENNKLTGFLYTKIENENENYSDIKPEFKPMKRLKIGTFKVIATGYRLGERFLQIIFDYAIESKVDEIYVTMFDNGDELQNLKKMLKEWGFEEYGYKKEKELVLVKKMKIYDLDKTIKQNYPNVNYNVNKWFLPILPQYHTRLFPDSVLFTERNDKFPDYLGYRYAIEKCYISFSFKKDFKIGDIVLIYRCAYDDEKKPYKSVITSICVISEIYRNLKSKEEMKGICKNRSVFNNKDLDYIWLKNRNAIQIVKVLYIKPLNTKIILKRLREIGIIGPYSGPRPFDEISDSQFDMIIKESTTKIYGYKNNIIKGN